MRMILFFDLPTLTSRQRREYRQFIKHLDSEGFVMIQFSVYSKLCINNSSANTMAKKTIMNCPADGDIRFLIISESQYQKIVNVNDVHSLQEQVTTTDRTVMIGGMNDN